LAQVGDFLIDVLGSAKDGQVLFNTMKSDTALKIFFARPER